MNKQGGFTFMEVMVTAVILSTGIVMIYQTFLASLDQQEYLVHRLYADNLLDQKIGELQRLYQGRGALPKQDAVESITVNNKNIPFTFNTLFKDVSGIDDLLQMDIGISWLEHGRPVHLARSVCLSR